MVAGSGLGAARRLRLGMVGGGEGAFIGGVHRMAARLDDRWELVAGSFSRDAERGRRSAAMLGVAEDRAYGDWREMARVEAARPDGIHAVSIVTPNASHHAIARAFLDAGIHVICDKPLCTTMEDARDLVRAVQASGRVFALTHNYTGYPMVRHARAMVEAGELGAIRVVQVEYPQDWLSTKLEETGQKQAAWRVDPAQAGPAGSLGDLGTHAHNIAEFVTGLRVESVCAELTSFVAGRALDDNAQAMLRFAGGARGLLWASQVAPGNENALKLRVYGEKAGLEWAQEHPNQLRFSPLGEAPRVLARGVGPLSPAAAHATRIPAGHPEGYLEAFGQIYRDAAEQVAARVEGRQADPAALLVPTVEDGARGIAFVAACVESSRRGGAWVGVEA
ncbi:Gfo/Idh/MocA family protein [Falsiroseomonas oryziterrae]|uniref:Gfo/Idh/MocA family protein n=1 Tax=Falsiroseomonas oryziterrae TaxID=2911368 RepID=UPI001F1F504D|nr:Gfo/Idh/MocA family oxidoreductase [Roseomonas sp. NPKOSM-4]